MTTDARLSEEDEKRLAEIRTMYVEKNRYTHSERGDAVTELLRIIDTLKKPCAECTELRDECEEQQQRIDWKNGKINRLCRVIAEWEAECERLRAELKDQTDAMSYWADKARVRQKQLAERDATIAELRGRFGICITCGERPWIFREPDKTTWQCDECRQLESAEGK